MIKQHRPAASDSLRPVCQLPRLLNSELKGTNYGLHENFNVCYNIRTNVCEQMKQEALWRDYFLGMSTDFVP